MPGPQTLFLQDNSIVRLEPGALAPLAALRRLYLHNNSLHALEAGAFRAQPHLLELALTRNRLRGLRGGAFAGLAQLRVLYLAGNQLTRLLDFTFLHLPVSAHLCSRPAPGSPDLTHCLCLSGCRSSTSKRTAWSCWRSRPWRDSPLWPSSTSAGTSWAPLAGRRCNP